MIMYPARNMAYENWSEASENWRNWPTSPGDHRNGPKRHQSFGLDAAAEGLCSNLYDPVFLTVWPPWRNRTSRPL